MNQLKDQTHKKKEKILQKINQRTIKPLKQKKQVTESSNFKKTWKSSERKKGEEEKENKSIDNEPIERKMKKKRRRSIKHIINDIVFFQKKKKNLNAHRKLVKTSTE